MVFVGAWEVGASHDAEVDFAVDDECQTDGVLLSPQESLGPVNRVEGPVAATWSPGVLAEIDGVEDGGLRERGGEDRVGEVDDHGAERGALLGAEMGRLLLADNGVCGEGRVDDRVDDGLGGVVCDGDRREIPLGLRHLLLLLLVSHQSLEHRPCHLARPAHTLNRHLPLPCKILRAHLSLGSVAGC